jgi:hypothetical protein
MSERVSLDDLLEGPMPLPASDTPVYDELLAEFAHRHHRSPLRRLLTYLGLLE